MKRGRSTRGKSHLQQLHFLSIPNAKFPAPNLLAHFDSLMALTSSIDDESNRKIILCSVESHLCCSNQLPYGETSPGFSVLFIPQSCCALTSTPDLPDSVDSVVQFVFTVEHCEVCEANLDEVFGGC